MEIFIKAMENDLSYIQNHINYINEVDKNGKSLLHYATLGSAHDVIDYLLIQEINLNIQDVSGETALFDCARKGKINIAQKLLKKYANPNLKNNKNETALHLACHKGNMDMIDLLIENGAFLNIKTKDDKLPIHYAILAGHHQHIETLMKKFNIKWDYLDSHLNNFLHYATYTTNPNLVEIFIKYDLDINALNDQLETPIFNAIKHSTPEILKLLLKNDALLSINNRRYETPEKTALVFNKEDMTSVIEAYKETPTYYNQIKEHAYKIAVLNRDHETLRNLVLERNPLRKDSLGLTAYDYAVKYNLTACINILKKLKM